MTIFVLDDSFSFSFDRRNSIMLLSESFVPREINREGNLCVEIYI